MRKAFHIILASFLALALAGCGSTGGGAPTSGVSTLTPAVMFGSGVEVTEAVDDTSDSEGISAAAGSGGEFGSGGLSVDLGSLAVVDGQGNVLFRYADGTHGDLSRLSNGFIVGLASNTVLDNALQDYREHIFESGVGYDLYKMTESSYLLHGGFFPLAGTYTEANPLTWSDFWGEVKAPDEWHDRNPYHDPDTSHWGILGQLNRIEGGTVQVENERGYFAGTITTIGSMLGLFENSSDLTLEHSTFGFWAVESKAQGTISSDKNDFSGGDQVDSVFTYYHPLFGGNATMAAAPPIDSQFTGVATGFAREEGDNRAEAFINGTAALSTNNSGRINSFVLDFDNFYKFDFNAGGSGLVMDAANGNFLFDSRNSDTAVTVTPNNDTTGILVDTTHSAMLHIVNGQFYGATNDAREAVGRFMMENVNSRGNPVSIMGAFGVHRP